MSAETNPVPGVPLDLWAACAIMYATGGAYAGNWTTLKAAVEQYLLNNINSSDAYANDPAAPRDVTAILAAITSAESQLETVAGYLESPSPASDPTSACVANGQGWIAPVYQAGLQLQASIVGA
jgi:hypothetical protein